MPCSSCHEAWPKLSPFGQNFKDNGYQMGNDRDAPIFQSPAYWPIAIRTTPQWHRESINRVQVDDGLGGQNNAEGKVTAHGFDYSGLDILTAGTLAKNISFLFVPSADETGAFHIESANLRFSNLLNSSWLNIKVGKFELDLLHSEKRGLTLSGNGGGYQNYHFQPLTETSYVFGIGDNQVGVEWMGHSKNDRTRISATLLSSTDGNPGLPTSRGYDGYFSASHAFEVGSLGVQRVGGFAYIGQAPTFFQFTSGGGGIAGTGVGNKTFYRAGLIGMWYFKKLDITTMYFHGSDSAFLATNTPANQPFGFVFSNCRITGETPNAKAFLGRPWRSYASVTFLKTEMTDNVRPSGWDNWRDPARESTVRYSEFNSTGPGANSDARARWARQLTAAEAQAFTLQKVLGGQDGWIP